MRRQVAAIVGLGFVVALTLSGAPAPAPAHLDVTVHEGTSMSVTVSPDGRTLALDLQGSIWTLPVAGGAVAGVDTGTVFIENGRFHGEKIIQVIASRDKM